MNVILLYDKWDGDVDGVFVTETSTSKDIQQIFDDVKNENDDWMFEDILDRLPNDCKFYGYYEIEGHVYY